MPGLPGKFARVRSAGVTLVGPFRWSLGMKRERLDGTTFEAAISADGTQVFSNGYAGPIDSTVTMEGWADTLSLNALYPADNLLIDLMYRKSVPIGHYNIAADVLDYTVGTAVRELSKFNCQLQSNGIVLAAQ